MDSDSGAKPDDDDDESLHSGDEGTASSEGSMSDMSDVSDSDASGSDAEEEEDNLEHLFEQSRLQVIALRRQLQHERQRVAAAVAPDEVQRQIARSIAETEARFQRLAVDWAQEKAGLQGKLEEAHATVGSAVQLQGEIRELRGAVRAAQAAKSEAARKVQDATSAKAALEAQLRAAVTQKETAWRKQVADLEQHLTTTKAEVAEVLEAQQAAWSLERATLQKSVAEASDRARRADEALAQQRLVTESWKQQARNATTDSVGAESAHRTAVALLEKQVEVLQLEMAGQQAACEEEKEQLREAAAAAVGTAATRGAALAQAAWKRQQAVLEADVAALRKQLHAARRASQQHVQATAGATEPAPTVASANDEGKGDAGRGGQDGAQAEQNLGEGMSLEQLQRLLRVYSRNLRTERRLNKQLEDELGRRRRAGEQHGTEKAEEGRDTNQVGSSGDTHSDRAAAAPHAVMEAPRTPVRSALAGRGGMLSAPGRPIDAVSLSSHDSSRTMDTERRHGRRGSLTSPRRAGPQFAMNESYMQVTLRSVWGLCWRCCVSGRVTAACAANPHRGRCWRSLQVSANGGARSLRGCWGVCGSLWEDLFGPAKGRNKNCLSAKSGCVAQLWSFMLVSPHEHFSHCGLVRWSARPPP